MSGDRFYRNPLNGDHRFDGDQLQAQLSLENGLRRGVLHEINAALKAGADPFAFPVGALSEDFCAGIRPAGTLGSSPPLEPKRMTLIGHVAAGAPGTYQDELWKCLLDPFVGRGFDRAPDAMVDELRRRISVLDFLALPQLAHRTHRYAPLDGTLVMTRRLLTCLDASDPYLQQELGGVAAKMLFRAQDGMRARLVSCETDSFGFATFCELVAFGAAIEPRIASSHIESTSERMPLVAALFDKQCWSSRGIGPERRLVVAGKLLDAGADINALTSGSKTALMVACVEGFVAGASLLLERGADAAIKDRRNWSAASYARKDGGSDGQAILAMLQASQALDALASVRNAHLKGVAASNSNLAEDGSMPRAPGPVPKGGNRSGWIHAFRGAR